MTVLMLTEHPLYTDQRKSAESKCAVPVARYLMSTMQSLEFLISKFFVITLHISHSYNYCLFFLKILLNKKICHKLLFSSNGLLYKVSIGQNGDTSVCFCIFLISETLNTHISIHHCRFCLF
jgi:hypothetical protein